MPLYEYQCKKCGHRFEKIQKFSDRLIKKCPECGGPVEQLLSAPAVQFKGQGWYVTDYARKGAGSSESGETGKDGASSKTADKPENTDSKKTEKKSEKTKKSS